MVVLAVLYMYVHESKHDHHIAVHVLWGVREHGPNLGVLGVDGERHILGEVE